MATSLAADANANIRVTGDVGEFEFEDSPYIMIGEANSGTAGPILLNRPCVCGA